MTTLNLERNQIGVEGVGVICESLKSNTTLKTLNMAGSPFDTSDRLGPAEAKIIAKMLKINAPLKNLNLYHNEIGAEGATAIAAALPR